MPAILDHRVVTLHPKIHGGLLADPTNREHRADMAEYGIEPIDLLVVQPLPVRHRSQHRADRHRRAGDGARRGQEPRFVGVVVDPADYGVVLDELRADGASARRRSGAWPATPSPESPRTTRRSPTWFDDDAPSAGLPDNVAPRR